MRNGTAVDRGCERGFHPSLQLEKTSNMLLQKKTPPQKKPFIVHWYVRSGWQNLFPLRKKDVEPHLASGGFDPLYRLGSREIYRFVC
jgi:hypothetical protein